MGHKTRVRQTGKAAPTMGLHILHNMTPLTNPTWQVIVAEREAEAKARGIRFERQVEDDDELEAA